MSSDLLLYGDTERSPALRHELPIAIGDPFLYAEVGGKVFLLSNSLERTRMAAARPDAELIDYDDVGFAELLRSGMSRAELLLEMTSRAVARTGVRRAIVDPEFPLAVADRLRADGIELVIDEEAITQRRRAKSDAELDGIRRAQRAAEAGMAAAAAVLRRADIDGDRLTLDGEPLLAETVRAAIREACAANGAPAPPDIVVASVHQGFGHEPGSGPLPARLPIQIDLWPRDERSGCWADMTRTFVVGEITEAVRAQEALVTEVRDRIEEAAKPGVLGRELYDLVCDVYEAAGHRTQRTGPGDDPNEGMQFSLGHGVGLEVHEAPGLGMTGRAPLVPGDVIAVEPGLWEREIGGVRYEDLLLITEDGCEVLTDFPYDLTP